MATVEEFLNIARAELGTTSGAKYWNWFFGGGYVNGDRTPYCACGVSWCLNKAGLTCPTFPRATAIDKRDALGGSMVDKKDLRPGDLVGFDWDFDQTGDHIGIVEYRTPGSNEFGTIEFNTNGGRVARRTRYLSQVTCGARPRFASGSVPTGLLDVDGWCGPKTVYKWQSDIGTPADSVISGQTYMNDKWRPNVNGIDRVGYGSQMVMKIQADILGFTGKDVDGDWGYDTSGGLQEILKKWGYYDGDIDHIFGHHSVEGLQLSLNAGKWKNL